MEYLASRGLDNAEAITKFKIGVSDRSLGRRIPSKQVKAGKEQRARLEALGVMKEATGHEALRGCITFPVLVSENKVGEIYGRRYTRAPENQRIGTCPVHTLAYGTRKRSHAPKKSFCANR